MSPLFKGLKTIQVCSPVTALWKKTTISTTEGEAWRTVGLLWQVKLDILLESGPHRMDRSCASARSGKVLVSVQMIHQGNGASQDDVHEDEQEVAEDLP